MQWHCAEFAARTTRSQTIFVNCFDRIIGTGAGVRGKPKIIVRSQIQAFRFCAGESVWKQILKSKWVDTFHLSHANRNSLKCPTPISRNAIFECDFCTWHTANRTIETITNAPIHISHIELLETVIKWHITLKADKKMLVTCDGKKITPTIATAIHRSM